jgi:hypothetical protein
MSYPIGFDTLRYIRSVSCHPLPGLFGRLSQPHVLELGDRILGLGQRYHLIFDKHIVSDTDQSKQDCRIAFIYLHVCTNKNVTRGAR